MAPVEGGDGWGRPSGAPSGLPVASPPGMPRFVAPGSADPTTMPPSAPLTALPPPPDDLHLPPPPPPGMGWSGAPSWAFADPTPVVRQRKSMTRGWACTALVWLLLIPVGIAVSIAYVIWVEANHEPPEDGTMEESWYMVAVFLLLMVWVGGCAVASLISAIIGTVRSRRRPEIRQAPVLAVVVWTFLGLLAAPVLLSLALGGVDQLFGFF